MASITVILTRYARGHLLAEQVEAIRGQSKQPEQVWLWQNRCDESNEADVAGLAIDRNCTNDFNWKFYGRFALGLLADTDFVAIFDDDTIPGRLWFENCLAVHAVSPGILGTGGVRVAADGYDREHDKWGWIRPGPRTVPVDYVGQAWFFERSVLAHLWSEQPATWDNGEDMHLSAAAQRHGAVRTYCPPHPIDDREMWGSTRPELDADEHATSLRSPTFWAERRACYDEQRRRGWRLLADDAGRSRPGVASG